MLTVTVAQDGSGDFASIAEAVLAVPYEEEALVQVGPGTVSYTHLDVYKRQGYPSASSGRSVYCTGCSCAASGSPEVCWA